MGSSMMFMLLSLSVLLFSRPAFSSSDSIDPNIVHQSDLTWMKRGYDENGSFHYTRPSMTFEPGDTPFRPVWDNRIEHNGSQSKWEWALTCNLDNDSSLETVVLSVDRFFAVDDTGDILFDLPTPQRSTLNLVMDVDGDGVSEIFVSQKGHGEEPPRMMVFDRIGNVLKRFEFRDMLGQPLNDGSPEIWTVQDLDSDGELEIIVALHASYDRYPRGIVCIGYDSWTIKWNYRFATHVSNMIFPDLDGDGIKEIVFGTSASKNLAVMALPPSTSTDLISYVVALKKYGERYSLYWKYEVPHEPGEYMYFHTMVSSADCIGNGDIEIICYQGDKIAEESREHGRIFLLKGNTPNPKGELLRSFTTPYAWVRPAGMADVDNDGNLEVVIVGDMLSHEDDYIAVFDLTEWRIQAERRVPDTGETDNRTWRPVAINDINGDGNIEIITCTVINGRITVYNGELEELWSYESHSGISTALVSDIIPGGVNEIIVIGDRIKLLTLDVDLDLVKRSPLDEEQYMFPGEIIGLEVDLENNGDITWITELSLIEEVSGRMNYLESRWIRSPRPGYADNYLFEWKPGNGSVGPINVSITINITQIKDGITSFQKMVSWRIWIITDRLMERFVLVEWDCPDEACVSGSVMVTVMISNRIQEDISPIGPRFDRIMDRIEAFELSLNLMDSIQKTSIPPTGGEFDFHLMAPEDPGEYMVSLEMCSKSGQLSMNDNRTIVVTTIIDDGMGIEIFALVLLLPVLGLASFVGFRKVRKVRIFPIFPLFSRDIDDTDNEMRMSIYNKIRERPGITPQQIQDELKINNYNAVRYHIDKLVAKEKVILKRDKDRRKIILCFSYDYGKNSIQYLSDAEISVLSRIIRKPGITRRELQENWEYSNGYLTQCIQNLESKGYIRTPSSSSYEANSQNEDLYRFTDRPIHINGPGIDKRMDKSGF